MKKFSEHLTIGAQPNNNDIQKLAEQGYRSVINLRTDGEADPILSPAEEGEAVRQAGLQYAHIPVSMNALTSEQMDRFRQAVRDLPGPIYVHCRGGTRAGFFAATQAAADEGRSGQDALCDIDAMELDIDSPAAREFARNYVDTQRAR